MSRPSAQAQRSALTSLFFIAMLGVCAAGAALFLPDRTVSNDPDTEHQSNLTLYGEIDQHSLAGTFLYVSPAGPVISGLIYSDTCPEGPGRCAYIGYVKGGMRTDEILNWRTIEHNGEKIITDSEDIPRFKVTTTLNGGVGSLMFYLEPIDGGYFTTGCYQRTDQSEVSCPSNS